PCTAPGPDTFVKVECPDEGTTAVQLSTEPTTTTTTGPKYKDCASCPHLPVSSSCPASSACETKNLTYETL
ncbi:hypothetical protein PMAYCL1PPCAC_30849, partial [Pristionchus mayeri]